MLEVDMQTYFSIDVAGDSFKVIKCPEPVRGADGLHYRSLVDFEQRVIWIDPSIAADDLPRVCACAISLAWKHRSVPKIAFEPVTQP